MVDGMVERIVAITVESIVHNVWFLLFGILLAAAAEAFLDRGNLLRTLSRSGWIGIVLGTAVGALTPLCSCGTAAVILALKAAGVPWSPIVAFLVSSPLMSPSEYVLMTGVLGSSMANAVLITSIVLGLASGGIAMFLEGSGAVLNTHQPPAAAASAVAVGAATSDTCGCSSRSAETAGCTCCPPAEPLAVEGPFARFTRALRKQGAFILKYFLAFALIGAATQALVPPEWIQGLFGPGRGYSVLTAALLGVPLYISCTASIPSTGSLMAMGMGKGPALAFLVSGPGTHIGALATLAMVAPKRIWWLYLGSVFLGGIAAGLAYGIV